MSNHPQKLVVFNSTSVEQAFLKEAQLLEEVKSSSLNHCLFLWQPSESTLVLPASRRWLPSPALSEQLDTNGWKILSRLTGGAPVPQVKGVINVSHIFRVDVETFGHQYQIQQGYQNLCGNLEVFFKKLSLKVDIHATPDSYCDGDYNINIGGKKVVGTAQRITRDKHKQQVVLAQACILIDVDIDTLILPVNLCNQHNGYDERVTSSAHTSLVQHLSPLPSMETLFKFIVDAFAETESVVFSEG